VKIFGLDERAQPRWLYRAEQLGLTAFSGLIPVFLAVGVIYLLQDPETQIRIRVSRITELENKLPPPQFNSLFIPPGPQAKNPYPPGPVITRTFIHKEADMLINSMLIRLTPKPTRY